MNQPLKNYSMRLSGHSRQWAIFFTCWIIYLFHLGPLPGVNENRYLDQVRSIVDEGRLDIDRYHYNTVDKGLVNGHFYPTAAPGPSLLAAPVYAVLEGALRTVAPHVMKQYDVAHYLRSQMGGVDTPDAFIETYPFAEFLLCHLVLTAMICGLLSAATTVMVYKTVERFSPRASPPAFIALTYAFGTLMFFYATRFYAHVPSTFFAFAAFLALLAVKEERVGRAWLLGAGLANGLAILMDYVVLPTVVATGVYGLIVSPRRDIWRFLAGNAIPLLGLLGYHYVCFGHPFAMPQTYMTGTNHAVFAGTFGLGWPDPAILWKLLFSSYRGMFLYMPILLCSIYALIRLLQDKQDPHRAEWRLIFSVIALQVLFNSMMKSFWIGGYTFGPRYLVPALPFLMIPLGEAFRWMPRRLVMGVGFASILINWAGVQYIVSQNAFGSVAMFLLSGPTTQLYEFFNMYFKTYTTWNIAISPLGGYLMLGIVLTMIWKGTWRSSRRKASGASMNS